ncbi:MAG: amino acid permease [Candidatus Heimdallarchaeota archaeon]|nr:amino acid permease [Candidatus Heimdallarchaeota archaeon]
MSIKKLGFWSSTSLVVGNMIGSGIFLLPASLALFGSISLVGWLFSSLGAILLASIFGNLSRLAPHLTGGPYAYTKISLDEFPAFLVAWGYWISIWCSNAAIAVALVGYLGVFFPILVSTPLAAIVTGLSFIWLITWVNSKQIKTVGFIQLITTILKITPIILIGFIGIFYINLDHFPGFNLTIESDLSALTAVTTLTFFAFLGMECATIPGSSIKNPETTIKKATITGTIITILVYVLSSAAIMGIIPAETLAESNAPFADAASLFWGEAAKYIVAAGAVISTLGALNGWILIQGQIPMAAAHDKLFPKIFGKTNNNGSPIAGIIISSLLVSFLMVLNYSKGLVEAFTFMIMLSTLSVIIPYLFSTASFAIMMFEKKEKGMTRKLITALLAFCFSIWIIIGSGHEVVFWGFLLLMAGIPFYVLLKRN